MRKIFLIICFICVVFSSKSQIDIDIGLSGGNSFYLGDINPDKLFYNSNFSYGGFIRFNSPDARYSLRLNGLLTTLEADDLDFKNQYQQNRQASFETNIGEISAYVEFNFIPFIVPPKSKKHKKFSPFLLTGITYCSSSLSDDSMAIPIGAGFKFLVFKKFSGQIEWIMKKTFTDQLDNLSDPLDFGKSSIFFNTDWYSYLGISLCFELFHGDKDCDNFLNYKKREDFRRKRKNK